MSSAAPPRGRTANGATQWDIVGLIRWASGYFAAKDISNARLESEWLLAHVLGLERVDLYVQHDRPLGPGELAQFKALVKRRSGGEPFQYILGKAPFYGRDFRVTPDVLIPRPETETLIRVLHQSMGAPEPGAILDIGTGSGCLAITAALLYPEAKVLAVDISADALSLAHENARRLGADNVDFQRLDVMTEEPIGTFDAILCNPPYVASGELPGLQREIRDHEPLAAITDGADGLSFFRRLAAIGANLLYDGGRLIMELGGVLQATAVSGMFRQAGFAVTIHDDLQSDPRVCESLKK